MEKEKTAHLGAVTTTGQSRTIPTSSSSSAFLFSLSLILFQFFILGVGEAGWSLILSDNISLVFQIESLPKDQHCLNFLQIPNANITASSSLPADLNVNVI